jgi:hypothetical protein
MPDDNRPATKQDLVELEGRLVEQMRDMQTEVLRAFHGWARPVETRLKVLPLIDERLGLLEDRVSEIERQKRA